MTMTRLGALFGIAFAVLIVAAALSSGDTPSGDDTDADIVAWYEDSGHQKLVLVDAYLFSGAAITLVLFAAVGLAPVLRAARRGGGAYATATLGLAALAAAGMAMGGIALASVGADVLINDAPVDPGSARALQSVGYGSLLVWGGLAASAMVATVSVAALREAVFPAWFGGLGILAAVVMLGAVIFIPMAALPIWALIASVLLFMRGDTAEPARV